MPQLHPDTFTFLKNLEANNNRDWFKAEKKTFDQIQEAFVEVVGDLIHRIAVFDEEVSGIDPKKCVMRIYRDIRFSKDKSPYNTHLSAHILGGGRQNETGQAGYYVRLAPGSSIVAGGAHLPPSSWIKQIRAEIDANADELREIIAAPDFKKYFGRITGDRLKTAPKGYPRDHPAIDLLQFKSFLAVHEVSDKKALSDGFPAYAVKVFAAYEPFKNFLNK